MYKKLVGGSLIALALCVAAYLTLNATGHAVTRRLNDEVWSEFEDYKIRFNKTYSSYDEHNQRYEIFLMNYIAAKVHNN